MLTAMRQVNTFPGNLGESVHHTGAFVRAPTHRFAGQEVAGGVQTLWATETLGGA